MTSDYVELHDQAEEVRRFVERDDGWWMLEGSCENWEFSRDRTRGFLTSFKPPGGPSTSLGSILVTANGRRLVVASIVKDEGLRMILMPREEERKRARNSDEFASVRGAGLAKEDEQEKLAAVMAASGNRYKSMVRRMLVQGATVEQIEEAIDTQTRQANREAAQGKATAEEEMKKPTGA